MVAQPDRPDPMIEAGNAESALAGRLRSHRARYQGLIDIIGRYRGLAQTGQWATPELESALRLLEDRLAAKRLRVAFVGEFSRGKSELINALFFAHLGGRLLPSAPGRTTMCPTEIHWDPEQGSSLRLLPIETRLSGLALGHYRQQPQLWTERAFGAASPAELRRELEALTATGDVSAATARTLGFTPTERMTPPPKVVVPRWRHALVSLPHPLLAAGLSILDTPGLNNLGAEPELTLGLLPEADAVVFVLAADTGVTRSDLEIWRRYIEASELLRGGRGLAVVLNKIDGLWDELEGEPGTARAIAGQVEAVARVLGLPESSVFPLSAKQALLAKLRGDRALLARSGIEAFEAYLAEALVQRRERLIEATVAAALEPLFESAAAVLAVRRRDCDRQIEALRTRGRDRHRQLLECLHQIRAQRQAYHVAHAEFQAGRERFLGEMQQLLDALSPERIEAIIRNRRRAMAGSLTTVGMKRSMQALCEELRGQLFAAMATEESLRTLLRELYGRLDPGDGLPAQAPPLTLRHYQGELQGIFDVADAFRRSLAATLMEQGFVVAKLNVTVIGRALQLFRAAHADAWSWSGLALVPLLQRLTAAKRQVEAQVARLRRRHAGGGLVAEELAALGAVQSALRHAQAELEELRGTLRVVRESG